VPLVLAAAVVYGLWDEESGVRTAARLRDDLAATRARIADHRARNEALRAEARELREDPFARERVIREELGLARPDEIVVRLPAPQDDGTPRIP